MSGSTTPVSMDVLLEERDFVRSLARRLVRDEASAEDIVQQTWVAALTRPPEDRRAVRGWLSGVVRRLTARHWRDRSARNRREGVAARPDRVPSVAEITAREEVRTRVVRAVLALKEPYRSVVTLRYLEGLPPREISRRLGVPVETVRTRLKRALALLKDRLDREHGGNRRAWLGALVPLAASWSEAATSGVLIMSAKLKIGVAAAVVIAAGAVLYQLLPERENAEPAAPVAEAPPPAVVDPEPVPALALPPAPVEHLVRGVLTDAEGNPIPDGAVAIVGDENPFGGEVGAIINNWRGRVVPAGDDGAFEARFDGPRRVRVSPRRTPAFEPDGGQSEWVETPAEDLRFTGRKMETCEIVVTCVDLARGGAVEDFLCTFASRDGAFVTWLDRDSERVALVRVPEAEREPTMTVRLLQPVTPEPVETTFTPVAGGRIAVELAYRSGSEARGVVTDADGKPVANALVYFGTQERGRGDEPFKPFDARRIADGVRTGPNGEFVLSGDGDTITVWHDDLSPVTIAKDDATEIVMPPRGTIRGRLLDAEGEPVAGETVVLDRKTRTKSDAEGRFVFPNVEAGERGLFLPGKRMGGVRLDPGETAEVTFGAGIPEVRLLLRADGKPMTSESRLKHTLLLGLGKAFLGHELRFDPTDSSFTVKGVLPGPHLLLLETGHVAVVNVTGPEVVVDLGAADLTIQGPEGTRLWILPTDGTEELTRLLAARVVRIRIPRSGEVKIGPLPAGRYVVGAKGFADEEIEVSGPGARVTLR